MGVIFFFIVFNSLMFSNFPLDSIHTVKKKKTIPMKIMTILHKVIKFRTIAATTPKTIAAQTTTTKIKMKSIMS